MIRRTRFFGGTGIPITFIGDHKQLGPVCEMNDENVVATRRNQTAILWKKSALFVDELFLRDNQDAIISQLFELAEPELKSFTFAKLNTTFRFGQNLADILSECVYQGFRLLSASTQGNLRITRIDAVLNQEPARKRQNMAEVQRIVSYLQDHPEIEDDTEADFVILTPYKKQVTLLGQYLVGARRLDRITNVHKSQGREWDTVILSVVDALSNRNKPWFTDTNNQKSGGLHVMNTAISRAKKHLILVCDGESWIRAHDSEQQLISRLLQATGC